ncbi:hypothetical protein SAMN04488109_1763 [Chryseolinea serpens]|uniref:Uncharacterized protein n=1 Tax=Chryseolinea serpens TaxID=947013 RepID=A0A1M5MIS4_9BACT|nr:hypothetical protein SAMN04488109_1763 [Chryseolinea serpens]
MVNTLCFIQVAIRESRQLPSSFLNQKGESLSLQTETKVINYMRN